MTRVDDNDFSFRTSYGLLSALKPLTQDRIWSLYNSIMMELSSKADQTAVVGDFVVCLPVGC